MADILITGGIVVTMDPGRRVLEDGAVAIEGDSIVAVGPSADVAATHPADRVIDAGRKVVMPGLIDAHAHAGHGLVKTMGCDDGQAWFEACEKIYLDELTQTEDMHEGLAAFMEKRQPAWNHR